VAEKRHKAGLPNHYILEDRQRTTPIEGPAARPEVHPPATASVIARSDVGKSNTKLRGGGDLRCQPAVYSAGWNPKGRGCAYSTNSTEGSVTRTLPRT
jgi:hypothetical protein